MAAKKHQKTPISQPSEIAGGEREISAGKFSIVGIGASAGGLEAFEGYIVEHDFPAIGRHRMLPNVRCITRKTDESPMILLAMEDVT